MVKISDGGKPDLTSNVSSSCNQCEITSIVSVSWTFVNKLTTAKPTILLFSAKVVLCMHSAKAEEFMT